MILIMYFCQSAQCLAWANLEFVTFLTRSLGAGITGMHHNAPTSLCITWCVYVFVGACAHVCGCAWRPERSFRCPPYLLSIFFLYESVSDWPGTWLLDWTGWLAFSRAWSSFLHLSSAGITDTHLHTWLLYWHWGSSSGPHAWEVSTLLTGPPP